jgi:hypothetical protein
MATLSDAHNVMSPDPDIEVEARRILDEAAARRVPVRLIGGLAVRSYVRGATVPVLTRKYGDIDLVTLKGRSKDVAAFIASLGYEPNRVFNATQGHSRLLFYDRPNERRLDVFVGEFKMCHEIPITERILRQPTAVPLAELLLMKLQVVELGPKDQTDIMTLLFHNELDSDDTGGINEDEVARLCARNWGLWRTCKTNVERVQAALATSGLTSEEQQVVAGRLGRLWARVEVEPKSAKWKVRARIGDRVRWYEEPDEVG